MIDEKSELEMVKVELEIAENQKVELNQAVTDLRRQVAALKEANEELEQECDSLKTALVAQMLLTNSTLSMAERALRERFGLKTASFVYDEDEE